MKILSFLVLVLSYSATAKSYSQNQRVSMEMDQATILDVLNEIKEQTGLRFVYYQDMFDESAKVDVEVENEEVKQVLDQLLRERGLECEVEEEVITFKKLVKPIPVPVVQEKKKVTGKVTDEDGIPLPGVSVIVKGTTIGVSTDIDGNYAINFFDGNAVIVYSFVGMITQEIVYKGQTLQNVTLFADTEQMAEVVVTGYQSISKERASGSFDKLSTEHLEKASSSISERLQGTLAGVNATVRADGSYDFEIRGQSSLYGDAQPLVVVDGFPVVQEDVYNEYGQLVSRFDPFSTINPNDVESITVLKDAAAGSIWGAKSANGVIVITTKKARKGKLKVDFSTFVKTSSMVDFDYLNPKASSAETIEYEKQMFEMNTTNTPWTLPSYSTYSAATAHSQAVLLMNQQRLNLISEDEMNAGLTRLAGLDNRGQIEDKLMQNPFTQQYSLSISGGTELTSNILSLMYEKGKDNFKGNDSEKAVVNFRNNTKLAKWLDFDFSGMMQYSSRDRNGVQNSDPSVSQYSAYGMMTGLQPYEMLLNEDGSQANLNNLFYYTPVLNGLVPTENFSYSDWSYNPIQELGARDFTIEELNARVQLGLNFRLMEGLNFNTKVLYERLVRKNKNVFGANSFTMRKMVNETSSWNQNTGVVDPIMPNGGGLTENTTTIKYYNWRNQLNFNRTFAEKHSINFIAGTEISNRVIERSDETDTFGYYNDERIGVGRLKKPYDAYASMWLGTPLMYGYYPIALDDVREFTYATARKYSLFANLSYTYNDKYSITGSYRTDASNLITDNSKYRYSPFWSVGGSWQMSKEDFLSDVDWLNRLTMRGTFGYLGNFDPSTSPYPLLAIEGAVDRYSLETTAKISNFGNPTLRWEKTRNINLGVDFAVLNSKLHGSVEVYHKLGADLIVNQSVPSMTGTSTQKFNNGEMVNKGIEIKLGTTLPVMGNDIKWTGNLNFAYNKNEITKFFKATYSQFDLFMGGTNAYSEGMDVNSIWAYDYAGMTNVGTDSDPLIKPSIHGENGAVYPITAYAPGNDARKYMSNQGTSVAPYIVGFQNSFKIYDFDLSFLVTGKFGHKYRRHGFDYKPLWGGNTVVNNKFSEVVNGDPNKIVPIPTNESNYYVYNSYVPYMSYLTESASHIRLQEVNLTYNLPKRFTSKLGLSRVQAYAQGNNLGTILWNDFDEDPEYPMGSIKPQKTFTFGLRVSL
ncbi:SusC/RagA family TonB-linked outer membrane protein [Marinifilum sp. RC60d5]|uniref:SusC/RagA family TonB-linked outer membrane protein n=1 Tax=Marinifilum sp. RC60d5 TaxID=3458414 RepID=UPI004034FC66